MCRISVGVYKRYEGSGQNFRKSSLSQFLYKYNSHPRNATNILHKCLHKMFTDLSGSINRGKEGELGKGGVGG